MAATGLVNAAAAASAWTAARGFAVDNRHRSEDEMHKYLDALFCFKDKVALVTGIRRAPLTSDWLQLA